VSAGLSSGTYYLTSVNSAVDGGFGYHGVSPAVQFYQVSPTNAFQEWTWNGSTLQNLGRPGYYLVDGSFGTVSESTNADNWTVTAANGGYTLMDNRTGNYLTNNNGALAMSATPSVFYATASTSVGAN
jgi:hypothetical protein